MLSVDLNCDMGESFGPWRMGNDAELMKHVSSVNIACGFHAGDATTIRKTVELAVENGVTIGAHPGYPDLQGFGRRNMSMSPEEICDLVLYQIAALKGICEAHGTRLDHVKPHGALYNQAAQDRRLSRAIAAAVKLADPSLVLYGLSGSLMISQAEEVGLKTASEVFADRTYQPDGTLTPRIMPNALVSDVEAATQQAIHMITTKSVIALDGTAVPVHPDTICIHGDGENALEFAVAISRTLAANGVVVRAVRDSQ